MFFLTFKTLIISLKSTRYKRAKLNVKRVINDVFRRTDCSLNTKINIINLTKSEWIGRYDMNLHKSTKSRPRENRRRWRCVDRLDTRNERPAKFLFLEQTHPHHRPANGIQRSGQPNSEWRQQSRDVHSMPFHSKIATQVEFNCN